MGTMITTREEAAAALLLDRAGAATAVRLAGEKYRRIEEEAGPGLEEWSAFNVYAEAVEEYLDAALRTIGYPPRALRAHVETFARLDARIAMMPPAQGLEDDLREEYLDAQDATIERRCLEVREAAQRLRSLADDSIREAEAAYGLPDAQAARHLHTAAYLLEAAHAHLRAAYILAAAGGRPDLEEAIAERIGWARETGRKWYAAYRYGRPSDRAALRAIAAQHPDGTAEEEAARLLAGEARYGGLLDRSRPLYLLAIEAGEAIGA